MTCPTLEVATTQDFARTSIFEALVVTSAMKEHLVQLAPALMGVTSSPPSTAESVSTTKVETGLMSVPVKPAPVVGILNDLILHMFDQFFSMMTYCTELVLSRRTSFEFVRPLLENHVENIQKVRGSD